MILTISLIDNLDMYVFSVYVAGSSCNVAIDPCSSQPCQNSGTCVQIGATGYRCVCTEGFIGSNCEEEEQSEYLALREYGVLLGTIVSCCNVFSFHSLAMFATLTFTIEEWGTNQKHDICK
jgi:hypothetical protein